MIVESPVKVKVLPPPVKVISEPVTVNDRESFDPPETEKPSAAEDKVKLFTVVNEAFLDESTIVLPPICSAPSVMLVAVKLPEVLSKEIVVSDAELASMEIEPVLVKIGVVTEVEKTGLLTVATVTVSVAPAVVVILVPAAIVTVSPVEIV